MPIYSILGQMFPNPSDRSMQLSLTACRCRIDLPVSSDVPIDVFYVISIDSCCQFSMFYFNFIGVYRHSINWYRNSIVFSCDFTDCQCHFIAFYNICDLHNSKIINFALIFKAFGKECLKNPSDSSMRLYLSACRWAGTALTFWYVVRGGACIQA